METSTVSPSLDGLAQDLPILGLDDISRPFDVSDEQINAIAAEAGLMPLLMVSVHITGRLDILASAGRTQPPQYSTDLSGGVPMERAAVLRDKIAAALREWRDAGCPPAHRPDEQQFRQMIDILVGRPLDAGYEALLAEELGFDGDARAFAWENSPSDAEKANKSVLIVGAGLSGIVMGYRLKQAGIPFEIVEKNAGAGGTWFENRFPGARVDVPSHCYSYSFLRDQRWPDLFSPWPSLRQYFQDAVNRLGLADHIRYETKVSRAVYDETSAEWHVTLHSAKGEEKRTVSAFISAVGQLNRPLIPDFDGQDQFEGLQLHTSHWPENLPLQGKKVAVIGTAATALQLVPELAKEAASLTVFQRSPTWVLVHPEYRRAISPAEQWAIDHLPGYARWYRVILYNWAYDSTPAHMQIDPEWTGGPQAVSAANDASRIRLTAGMKAAIGDRPDLWDKLIPTYPPYVKRPNLGDGSFFQAFSLPHVSLCTDGIERFDTTGIWDTSGTHHDFDLVVYATGFKALEYLAPMEIVGRDGVRIDEFWNDEARAYLGIAVPKFPNLFLMYGPGTNLGFNGNLFFNAECQARFISECLKWSIEDGFDAIEVKDNVFADYTARMDNALSRFTWSHAGAGSWYKNKEGKVIANSPWPLQNYWDWTRSPVKTEFHQIIGRKCSAV